MAFSVAIDGPAGAGKGTIAKYLSERFNLKHLDTGLLYREAARLVVEEKANILDVVRLEAIAQKVDTHHIIEENLRNEEIASVASQIAVVPSLRRVLTQKMRDFASSVSSAYQGVVLDGRHVGSVILPQADVKIYVTADEQVRVLRRTKELGSVAMQEILEGIKARDARDGNRQTAPLQVADGAIVLDTTFLDIKEVCEKAAEIVEEGLSNCEAIENMSKTSSCLSKK
ncbi:MAG: (d)CMP kinase [Proteobacteria bacterium]|nr:(d)CMP kinase [Pseudomonadota bacterium]